ncbi:hypothetical protein BST61_g11490 [Cercospora zeina]
MSAPTPIKITTPGQKVMQKKKPEEAKQPSQPSASNTEPLWSPKRARRPEHGKSLSMFAEPNKSPKTPLPASLSPKLARRPPVPPSAFATPSRGPIHNRANSDPTPSRSSILKTSRQEETFQPGMFSPGWERAEGDEIRRQLFERKKGQEQRKDERGR